MDFYLKDHLPFLLKPAVRGIGRRGVLFYFFYPIILLACGTLGSCPFIFLAFGMLTPYPFIFLIFSTVV